MSANVSGARRSRLLAELGIVRYRLRGTRAPAVATAAMTTPATPATGTASVVDRDTGSSLAVNAAGIIEPPSGGIEAAIWTQVLAWLGYRADEVEWARGEGAVALPPMRNWATPQGKRGLWNALKAHVRAGR